MLTPRFFVFSLGVPALLILAAAFAWLTPIAIVYGLGLAFLLFLDRRTAGTITQFKVERLHDQKLSLGVQNKITISISTRSPRPIDLSVRDEPPLLFVVSKTPPPSPLPELKEGEQNGTNGTFKASPLTQRGNLAVTFPLLSGTIRPNELLELSYHVRPLKRGDFAFGNLNLRWNGPLNFYVRQAKINAAAPVKVYPNLHEIRAYDLLARRDQLAEIGLRGVRLRGEGTAFESLRDYTPDDAYRSINWKATARRGKPISTDYEPERSQRVLIAVDIGRMMRSPIRVDDPDGVSWNMAKVDFVINSILLFSYVATLRGDQVGLLIFADQVQSYYAPGAGRAQFQRLLEAMYALESQPVEADYGRAITFLGVQNRKRSLVVLFTDLSDSRAGESLLTHLPRLAPRHLPLLVTIRDPILGQVAAYQPHDSDTVYQRAVAEQLIDERRLVLENLGRRGVLTLDVAAEQLTMEVVNRYLQIKARSLI